MPKLTEAEIRTLFAAEFPQSLEMFEIETRPNGDLGLRLKVDETHLRPGGTISGPTMFALADVAFYVALLAEIGPQTLAVTTNISMDFMRKPPAGQGMYAETRLLKVGRSLAVGDVLIYSDVLDAPVARASLTYAIPPAKQA